MIFHHILFPVDFSQRSGDAARHVEAMAQRFQCKVTLLHVRWHGEIAEFVLANDPYSLVPVKELKNRLETFAMERLASIETNKAVEEGEPGQAIVRYAQENGVDLIMMPSHGYGPFRSLLLGSVTAKVLHDAQCPVWTGAHIEVSAENTHTTWRTILCAVDLGPRTDSLMKWSAQLAGEMGATLRIVSATPGGEIWLDRQFGSDLTQEVHRIALRRLEDFQKEAGVEASVCVAAGSPASVLAEEAQRDDADLMIIGRGSIKGSLGRLRTHAYGIIRESPCPVISV